MKHILSITLSLAAALACAAQTPVPVTTVGQPMRAPQVTNAAIPLSHRQAAPLRNLNRADEALQAAFSVQGFGEPTVSWSENFDAGWGDWVVTHDEGNAITWELTKTTGAGKAFSEIDSADVQSLHIDGPYQTWKRATSYITSGKVPVPTGGVLHGYIYYSQNLNDYAVLTIAASTDGFKTSTDVWRSTDEAGSGGSRWHQIAVNLGAFAGKTIQLRFTYGPGTTDDFKAGGYMASYTIDGLTVTGVAEVNNISVTTGQTVQFIDMSAGKPAKWQWTFAGGTPATSTEPSPTVLYTRDGKYDVSLTVTDAQGNTSTVSKPGFVSVTGSAPVAKILPPATFRYSATHLPMVCPLVPVQYHDASTGYPTAWNWTFSATSPATSTEQEPWVSYENMHQQKVKLVVSNEHGTSQDTMSVSAEYEGTINNLLAGDVPVTYDLGDGTFPGDNKMGISAYAERFSKPSRPIMVYGAFVYFVSHEATGVADQIADVGVHLYTAKDGLPDKKVESTWWRVFELDGPTATSLKGTWFEFTPQVVRDEFFMVVDGIPEHNDSLDVSFAMASLRDHGNTAYFMDSRGWRPMTGYFSQDKGQSSFYIFPLIAHSAITLLPVGKDTIEVPATAGTIEQQIFSIYGYKTPVENDADWCRLTNTPNGLTLDTLKLEFDALPAGTLSRVAHLKFTDGMDTILVNVVQQADVLVGDINQDGVVNVEDVTQLVNRILGISKPDDALCDMNGDGQINVDDVTRLVNLILANK